MRDAYELTATATITIVMPVSWIEGGTLSGSKDPDEVEELAGEKFWEAARDAIKDAEAHSQHLRDVARTMHGSIDSKTWRQTRPNYDKFFPADIEIEVNSPDKWDCETIERDVEDR